MKNLFNKDKSLKQHKQLTHELETNKAKKQAKKFGTIPTYLRKFRQEEEQERIRT
jgi:hypothetical protein